MRMPAATKAGGECLCPPTNFCKTPQPSGPPVPMPYPSKASPSGADKCSKKVLIEKKESCTEQSVMKSSMGDQPGVNKGAKSNTTSDAVAFESQSPKVYFENKKAIPHLATTSHNGKNANQPVGKHASPSQTKVHVAS